MTLKRISLLIFLLFTLFIAYRFVRPLQIFVVSPEFERPIDVGSTPEGLYSVSAKICGQCHLEIYEEWSTSMHAKAWIDPYFQVDYAFDGKQQICLNCHTPLKNQQKNLVLGFRDANKFDPILKPNLNFDPSLQSEGVTCAVCHVREGYILGPYGSNKAAHPVKKDEEMTDTYSICKRCHMVMGKRWDTFYRFPPCGTYGEVREAGKEPECKKCHMAKIKRAGVIRNEVMPVSRHLWRGGHDPEMVKSALTIELKKEYERGNAVDYNLILANSGADHRVPTGTPDRHLTVSFRLLDKNEKVIKEENHKLKRTIMWRPFIVDLWDTRLKAGEMRLFTFSHKKGDKAAFVDVEVRYHLLDEKRRKRIGYENREPINYRVFYRRIEVK